MASIDFKQLRVAITGASSGIGEATARELAKRGASVAISARRTDRLKTLAAELETLGAANVSWTKCDVSVWKDVANFAAATKKALGDVDVVFANAGYGNIGHTLDIPPEAVSALFQTNTTGAIWTIQAFGDQLERRKGHAIITGSVVSKIPIPYSSIYSASKWALRGWTRAARPELESRNIALTLLNPGYVRTEFFQNRVLASGVKEWNPLRGMSSEQVARRVLKIIRRRPKEVGLTWAQHIGVPIYRLFPFLVPKILAKKIRGRADSRFLKRDRS